MKKRVFLYSGVLVLLIIGFFSLFKPSKAQETLEQNIPPPGNGLDLQAAQNESLPQGHVGEGKIHKVFVDTRKSDVYDSIASRGAIVKEIDYGSFKMLIVDEDRGITRDELTALDAEIRDEQNLIPINGFILDTTDGKANLNRIPADLRQTAMADSLTGNTRPGKGLFIVQFIGPIQDAWLDDLRATGGEVVTYLPQNAYVIRAGAKAAAAVREFRSESFVQFVGDYEPAFRLSPELQSFRDSNYAVDVDITVQVIDGRRSDETVARLKEMSTEVVSDNTVLNYRNIAIRVNGSRLGEIASMENVFALEERTEIERLDEAQGQIVAGNLTGTVPLGPGYLSFLNGAGFTSSQFGTFSVNVVDDVYQITGAWQHPDLPASRVVFQNNPTCQSGPQGAHGFLDAHIVGGFNNGTGSALEDANGYNYGLGIAPYARVGVTAIFGPCGNFSPTAWENMAYGQTARISTNSWGFKGVAYRRYDTTAQEYDRIVRDAQSSVAGNQQMIVAFAAGNDGSAANTVGSPSTAKNVITAAASENVRQTGTDGCGWPNSSANSANEIASFSSRGPVNSFGGDGRVKPDLSAPGTHIQAGFPQSSFTSGCLSFWPAGQTLYGWATGTSQSCPAIAGGTALVFQDFLNKSLGAPGPAMAKATLMNSAAYMSGTGAGGSLPSNSQGMGRMDLGRTFDSTPRIRANETQLFHNTGNTYSVTGFVKDITKPYRVTIAWTDAPGPTTGAPFVNNLDLEVTINGVTYKGNVFSGANSASGGTADAKNNVESVFLPAGTSGNFNVTVKAANIAGDGVPGNADTTDQDFALVIYNAISGCPPAPISFGQKVNGNLQTVDCLFSDNSLYDAYTFNATAGEQVYITMNSTQFDPYLLLVYGTYPGGNVLVQNDNGGGGTNARIPATSGYFTIPASGKYTILAKALTSGLTGSYSLTLIRKTWWGPPSDFDGDRLADISVFRPSDGNWYGLNSSDSTFFAMHFGTAGDRPVPDDFDNDDKTDIAVFRPSNGTWYWVNSSTGAFSEIQFGLNGDLPRPGDFDGDGASDLCVYRPSAGVWYRLNSSDGQFIAQSFGLAGDQPAVGDFDGDGKGDLCVFRPSNGDWYRLNSSDGQFVAIHFGLNGDKPTPADYDGDGKEDVSVFRPSTGDWHRINSSTGELVSFQFGVTGDLPVPADFDGDGEADIGVFRPSSGTWYLQRSTAGFSAQVFGTNGDHPIPNSFVY